jgi:hypothetical protein
MTQAPLLPARTSTLLEQQIQETFAYQPAWLDLISRLYGYSVTPLTITNSSGELTGYLPICSLYSPLTGRRLVSLPFSDHSPLLAEDEASAHALIDKAIQLAQMQKARYLELRTGGGHPALARDAHLAESSLYVRWLLPLTCGADPIWSGLRKPVQRQIKKSQHLGVQVRIAETRADMDVYYRLHLQTRSKKHGMPAQPPRFFFGLWDAFAASDRMKLLLAHYEGKVIAGMILLACGSMVHYAYGASDECYLQLAPNNLLMWQAITWACEQGYQTFDLGRTACDNEGLMEFKRRWGATKEPLTYYYYPQMAGLASTSEQSLKFRVLTTCWRQLPLQVTGPLGGYLYKHLG